MHCSRSLFFSQVIFPPCKARTPVSTDDWLVIVATIDWMTVHGKVR